MDAQAQMTISGKQLKTQGLIRECLVRLAAVYNHVPSAAVFDIWVQALSDLTCEQISYCFHEVEKTFKPTSACPFPVPAHVRELVDSTVEEAQVESAWQKVVKELEWWSPDTPNRGSVCGPRISYAVRAAGGWMALWNESRANMPFRKRDFVAAFRNYKELEGLGLLSPWTSKGMQELSQHIKTLAEGKRMQ